ncbi:MAG: hypothetical protein IKU66_06910 [Clostridia bacterium]|nr:hypothetical protein [Clostridia bacterium]
MKIEIGESLFYSWLRHVKQCQIVQNNWKVSSQWNNNYEKELEFLMNKVDDFFAEKYNYKIFKNNVSISQLLMQAECDVLGISISENESKIYAIDVAFHENGLNYGSREMTVMKIIEKCARTAFCLYGYLDNKDAEIIFASPKITPAVLNDLHPCIDDLNKIFAQYGFTYKFGLIANEEFDTKVLQQILSVSNDVADTTELFMRSYQMFKMFDSYKKPVQRKASRVNHIKSAIELEDVSEDAYAELKVGEIARRILAPMLINGCATEDEIKWMQTADYSKQFFGLNYPVLIKTNAIKKEDRYYAQLLNIYGETYRMCSEWFETSVNDDRTPLLRWINKHKK